MSLIYKLLGAGVLAVALMAAIWKIDKSRQTIGYNVAVAEYTAQALKAEQDARIREGILQLQVSKAQNDSKIRENKLAADAANARSAADSLRNDLTAVRSSLPRLTRDAVDSYAATASIVFEQCVNEYSDLAAKTDGLASDRQTLIDAWPR